MSFDSSRSPDETPTVPHASAGKGLCQYCSRPFTAGQGLTNHERGCQLNPARRDRASQKRKTCPKCRRLISLGQFDRHVPKCKGRKGEKVPDDVVVTPLRKAEPLFPDLQAEATSEILVELLFPNGMPTHAEFVRAFRAWLDATDKLVAVAGMDQ